MSKEALRDGKTATEYRLSISSNPGSRRSSISDFGDHIKTGFNDKNSHNSKELQGATAVDICLLPQIQELTDSVITLDSNFMHMNFIHESLVDLNESVSALLYGLMCNSWCVDFSNLPHDTAHELRVCQELNHLEKQRRQLLSQLCETKEPLLPTVHESLAIQNFKNSQNKLGFFNKITKSTSLEDDEDNTAASFVSNPTILTAQVPNIKQCENINEDSTRRKRRYSILNQIRNNEQGTYYKSETLTQGSSSLPKRSSTHPASSINTEKTKSLSVSASRIANRKHSMGRPYSVGKTVSTRNTMPSTLSNPPGVYNRKPPFR